VLAWIATVRSRRSAPPGSPPPSARLRRAMTAGALFVAVASMFSGGYYDSRLAWCFAALAAALKVTREAASPFAARAERALATLSEPV
jgi:hypothetical protein